MKITSEIKKALEQLCEDQDLTSERLGLLVGVSQRTANRWLNGEAKKIHESNWASLSPYLIRYLPSESSIVKSPPNFADVSMREVPLVSMAAAVARNPAIIPIADFLDENTEDKVMFPNGMGKDGDFAIRICGDSMSPWYPDGTVVLVRPQKPLTGDKVVAVLADGEVVFKYFVDNDDEYTLAPENSHGAAITVKKSDFGKIRSMYRVICSIRNELDVQRDARAEGYKPSWEQYVKKGGEK